MIYFVIAPEENENLKKGTDSLLENVENIMMIINESSDLRRFYNIHYLH